MVGRVDCWKELYGIVLILLLLKLLLFNQTDADV